jgi:HAD superfamily hydrolase (TIGR01509 family)
MLMMNTPELIIFDCDGVLVDSEPLANQVMADYLSEHGMPCSRQQATARFVGLSLSTVRSDILAKEGLSLPGDFEEELLRRDYIVFETALKAIDGVQSALTSLNLQICVASSGSHQKIQNSLTLTGLIDHFDGHIFSAADVRNGKPAPDLFLHAAREMKCAPANCIVIEDSLAGVQAGVAAGMRVFGFLGGGHIGDGHGDKLINAGAHRVFANMDTLGDHIATP